MADHSATRDDVPSLVRRELLTTLREQGKVVAALADDDALTATLGLSSSDVIALSARLTTRLKLTASIRLDDVRTVMDLCRACSSARHGRSHASAEMRELDAVRQRAWARARRGPRSA